MKTPPLLALLLAFALSNASATPPIVSNVRPSQIAGTKNVEILYDVSDADGDALTIGMQVSGDAGQTYTIPATALSGHVGAGVTSGANRRIIWNAGVDWNGQFVSSAKVRVTASDGTTPVPPPGMVYIPAGTFQMGDNFNEIGPETLPVHQVETSEFFMDRFEVTKELWQSVQIWGQGHGYSISAGSYVATGYPVELINWYDAVRWCNARSEKEGLVPVYYMDDAQTAVYRGNFVVNVTNAQVKWGANGYRLPTEAEWEKAARGGTLGLRFPWGNMINGSQANYIGSGDIAESGNPGTETVGYYNGLQLPAGVDMANGYGLYDMAGNVWEWCWDFGLDTYYGDSAANNNPHGPLSGSDRVFRGGGWSSAPTNTLHCAYRGFYPPGQSNNSIGLRCVKSK